MMSVGVDLGPAISEACFLCLTNDMPWWGWVLLVAAGVVAGVILGGPALGGGLAAMAVGGVVGGLFGLGLAKVISRGGRMVQSGQRHTANPTYANGKQFANDAIDFFGEVFLFTHPTRPLDPTGPEGSTDDQPSGDAIGKRIRKLNEIDTEP